MTLQEITQLVAFNRWADQRFFEALNLLSVEHYGRDLQSSHGGIHGTLAHIVGVEKAWLCRWQGQPSTAATDLHDVHSLAALRAQTQTINQRPQIGVTVDLGGLDWFHRLCQWFRSMVAQRRAIDPVSSYGTWDGQRERFQPFRADSAADHVISQNGASWAERIYSGSI